ncbi:MAG TPA: DsbA family oxidoreductase [Blastocatellia bacterium]|nr:DsbA family oxidoreductase [Blastocatellia bacterium]
MPVVIQVFSDYVCPYCYLGEVPLRNAVARTGAEIVWRAFQLRESGPPPFEPGSERMNASWNHSVFPLANRLGVEIRQPSRSPLTRLAHEAAAWARSKDSFDQFHRRLFKAFFLENRDISELTVLKEIAWQSGLNPADLEKALAERRMADEVDEDLLIARTYGIATVPSFVIGGHVLAGVQDEAVLIRAIELASEGKLEAETKKLPHLPIQIAR